MGNLRTGLVNARLQIIASKLQACTNHSPQVYICPHAPTLNVSRPSTTLVFAPCVPLLRAAHLVSSRYPGYVCPSASNHRSPIVLVDDRAHFEMSSSSSNVAPGQDTTPSPAPAMHPTLSAPAAAERVAVKLDFFRRTLADPPHYMEPHRANLLFLVKYYENGGEEPAPGESRWIMDGEILDSEPTFPTPSPAFRDTVCLLPVPCHSLG